MGGETDLKKLLRDMSPTLNPGEYIFCSIPEAQAPAAWGVLGSFREREGLTVILPRSRADDLRLPYSFVGAWITLNVHSALEAVGLTAAVSQALADARISCNIVAGYYHDHLFVELEDAASALGILQDLARRAT